ncbi:hypothetical protein HK100_002486 [Physocladia obscura]|uniref:AAA+ ATPase domain-containing protein n=1 Tax=Physocladia obscura TaxID=109957 RepID=A0AAD5XFE2_9FUNG|nr:hypothetical protein HK100_002486 [Physocladia obscura]
MTEVFTVGNTDGDIELIVHDNKIIDILENYVSFESFYTIPPTLRISQLFSIVPKLKKLIEHEPPLRKDEPVYVNKIGYTPERGIAKLIQYLEAENHGASQTMLKMAEKGVIAFKYLTHLFVVDTFAVSYINGAPLGLLIENAGIVQGAYQTFFEITGKFINSNGKDFRYTTKTWTITSFDDVVPISSLSVQPLDEGSELFELLEERGKRFEKYAIGNSYLSYSDNMFFVGWGAVFFKAQGRVMIDAASFAQMNPNYSMGDARIDMNRQTQKTKLTNVPTHHYAICSPTLFGFSFTVKKWGEIFVQHLSPIQFDGNAFHRLVLDPERKKLILNLVNAENHKATKNLDLISGKGSGMIFLLHGSPGVGKTLTGESIAEYLHKPLYSVSSGELGTDVLSLEKKLSEILEVASLWQAVILIDEADIFLEARSEHDIQRNALVGIFLRLLEYHQGILFLTTNRVQSFDLAFKSRITLSLKYSELDPTARIKIWRTFLDRSEGVDGWNFDLQELSEVRLNGREIKNVVRLAKVMGEFPDDPIQLANILKVLKMMSDFDQEIETEKKAAQAQYRRRSNRMLSYLMFVLALMSIFF